LSGSAKNSGTPRSFLKQTTPTEPVQIDCSGSQLQRRGIRIIVWKSFDAPGQILNSRFTFMFPEQLSSSARSVHRRIPVPQSTSISKGLDANAPVDDFSAVCDHASAAMLKELNIKIIQGMLNMA
jgi:hypothetical protein